MKLLNWMFGRKEDAIVATESPEKMGESGIYMKSRPMNTFSSMIDFISRNADFDTYRMSISRDRTDSGFVSTVSLKNRESGDIAWSIEWSHDNTELIVISLPIEVLALKGPIDV